MKNNFKYFILLTILLFLSISVVSASDNTTTDTTTTHTLEQTTPNIEKVATSTEVKKIQKENKNTSLKTDEQTKDYYVSDTSGSDTNTGTQDSPFKTIQTAIDKTGNDATYNIHIAEGTYKGLGNTNLTVNGNYNINFIGAGTEKTIFDGESDYDIDLTEYHWESSDIWSFYVNSTGNWFMSINKGTGKILLTNFTIYDMYSLGGSSIDAYLHSTVDNYANLEVNNMNFTQNHGGVGSAIRNNNGATLLVNNSLFEDNMKSSSTGNDGIIYNNGTATIINSLFNHNYARWGTILNDKNITVINNTLSNNIGYDGKSTYKYGTGVAFNTGNADFYFPGHILTYNTIANNTFINNDQTDICGFAGNMNLTGNKFINSTGVYIRDPFEGNKYTYLIDNNTFENMIPSSINSSLSSGNLQFSINSEVIDANIIISNNNITSKQGTVNANNAQIINNTIDCLGDGNSIYVFGNSVVENNNLYSPVLLDNYGNHVRYNTIQTDIVYTVNVIGSENSVTNNYLTSLNKNGDDSVNVLKNDSFNIVQDNEGIPIYCHPDVTTPNEGTKDNPTTIEDALTKVKNNQTILLLHGENGIYNIENTITIGATTLLSGVIEFKIVGENVILDGGNNKQIMNIPRRVILTFENITFKNGFSSNGGALFAENSIILLKNVNFYNNNATNGGALNIKGTDDTARRLLSNLHMENVTFENNYAAAGGAIYFMGANWTLNGENIFINNTATSIAGVMYFNSFQNAGFPIINGTNTFINNIARNNGGCFYQGGNTLFTITGNNTFINSSANTGGTILGVTMNISGNNTFINSNANSMGGSISASTMNITDAVFNNSTSPTGAAIQSNSANINNCTFINCLGGGETINLNFNSVVKNNNYENCTFIRNFNIELSENNSYPIQIYDSVLVNIFNETLKNPQNYDPDITEKTNISYSPVSYQIYANNALVNTTNEGVTSFNVKPDKIEDFSVYAKSSSGGVSNTLTFDVEEYNLKNVYIVSPINSIDFNKTGNITVKIFDKTNTPIENVGTVIIYDTTNNQIIGSASPVNGVANIQVGPYDTWTQYGINIYYLANSTYNNKTNTSLVVVANHDVYVSSEVTEVAEGTIDNPTTLLDAVSKVAHFGTIHLLPGTNGTYENNQITTLGSGLTRPGVTSFNITAEDDSITFTSTETNSIFTISNGLTVQFNHIKFVNLKNSAINNNGGILIINGTCVFENNTAQRGAAIISTNYNSYTLITGKNQFINNTATQSGNGGGAIYSSGNLTIIGENSFINNTINITQTGAYGGAITVKRQGSRDPYATFIMYGKNIFDSNTAITSTTTAYGGAIYLQANSTITGENIFTNNKAIDQGTYAYGGAIYGTDIRNLTISGKNIFINNIAGKGGAITKLQVNTNIIGNTFINNTATISGGDIYTSGQEVNIKDNTFINSKSVNSGSIYSSDSVKLVIENNSFTNITSEENGGAITYDGTGTITITNNNFTNIKASEETLNLGTTKSITVKENNYNNCTIGIENINITSPQENKTIQETTPINIEINCQLKHPEYYDENIIDKFNYHIFLNDENIYTTTNTTPTINGKYTKENQGILNIYATKDEVQTNIIQVFLEKPSANIEITIPTENTVNKTTPITIMIKDNNGNLITGENITINIDGNNETIYAQNGAIVYQYTPTQIGNNTITITLQETDTINETIQTATINIIADKDKIIEDLNKNLTETTEKLENTTQKADDLEEQLADANKTINNQKTTLDNLNKTLTQTQQALENADKKLTEQNNTINNLEKQLQDTNKKVDDLTKANNDLTKKLNDANNKINTLTQANNNLSKQLADTNKKVDDLTQKVNDLTKQLVDSQKTVDNLNKTVAARDATIKELTTKIATKVTVTKINTTKYASTVTVTGKVTDNNGKALNNMPVSIKINTATIKVVTNANGVYTYTTTANTIGTNNVTVTSIANDKYTSSSAKTTFKVSKATPTLKLGSISAVKYKDTVIISGSLMDTNNKAINGASLSLKINTKTITIKTGTDGTFTYKTTATTMGTNNVTVTYNGNTKYNKVTKKATFKVAKQNLILTVDRVASGLKYKDPLVVGGRLVDGNNKAVANTLVSLQFNGKTYKAKTDKNGYYKITTRATTMGTNTLTTTYSGNTKYNKASAKTTFTVAKQDLVITFNTVKYTNGKVTISGTFTDRNRHALMNSLARITLNGKQGTAKTDKTGTFTYTTQAKQGTYKVTLAYPGNERYNAYSKTTTVNTA